MNIIIDNGSTAKLLFKWGPKEYRVYFLKQKKTKLGGILEKWDIAMKEQKKDLGSNYSRITKV